MTNRIDAIRARLQEGLEATHLEVIDDSAAHHGHVGAQSGAGHFTVKIASPQFAGKTPVACHQLVYRALGDMMHSEIHALRILLK